MTEQKTDYEIYLERYCNKRKLTKEVAERHLIVKLVKKYYEEGRANERKCN